MSDIAIRVEGLGKKYRLGANTGPYKTLCESLTGAAIAPARMAARMARRTPTVEGDRGHRPEFWAVKDVSFDVKHGEVLGIIGRNGAGKSTLLKLLSQITEPTEGRIGINGRVASLLEVGTGFHPELSGRENVFLNGAILGMARTEIERKFDEIVAFAEVEKFIDTPVKHYSSGMYLRLAFAVAAHLEPEILIVDEVLAVGDADFQKKCMGKMGSVAKEGRTVLFVSHNLAAVKNICSTGILLNHGRILFRGPSYEVVKSYESNGSQRLAMKDGFIYRTPDHLSEGAYVVDRVELLDQRGQRLQKLSTWSDVCFRIWYRAKTSMRGGSVVLTVKTMDGINLLLCSTSPDSNVPLNFQRGEHYVDCYFEQFPLAAGTYLLGVGLAQPHAAWLYLDDAAVPLTVLPEDVYESGFAPQAVRALIATPHKWYLGT